MCFYELACSLSISNGFLNAHLFQGFDIQLNTWMIGLDEYLYIIGDLNLKLNSKFDYLAVQY